MDDYKELLERLRSARISPFDLGPVADAIESLCAENEREYQELAAKRLEEIAKYRDAPVVAWVEVVDSYEGPYHFNGEKLLNVGKHKLIVKQGEEK